MNGGVSGEEKIEGLTCDCVDSFSSGRWLVTSPHAALGPQHHSCVRPSSASSARIAVHVSLHLSSWVTNLLAVEEAVLLEMGQICVEGHGAMC